MDLRFTVQTKIQKPVDEVFEAVQNPKKLSSYFTTGGTDGPLDEGKTVLWKFNDIGDKIVTVPVKVQKVVRNKLIRFSWEASEGVYDPKTGSIPQPGGYDTGCRDRLRASQRKRDAREDRRGQVAIYRERFARLIRELSGLDADDTLPEGVPGVRDQLTERLFLATKIELERINSRCA